MDKRTLWHSNTVLDKKFANIDKLYILDILILKLPIKTHLFIAKDMLIYMQRIGGILSG